MKILGLDLYNFAVTGDKACNMNANSNMSAGHAGPTLLILNDQVGSVMDVSEDVTATLRAQDRHAIAYALEGNGARPSHMGVGYSDNGKMYTLNTIEQHSVCYPINTMVATRGGQDDMRTTFGIGEDGDPQFTISAAHSHAVFYEVEK